MKADDFASLVNASAGECDELARDIWEHPEPAFHEERSAELHRKFLASRGFTLRDCPEMPHSFIAEKGEGGAVIGFMGEYDALPGMSQACEAERRPLVEGGPGHACGHNLLGVGSLAAAAAAAEALEAEGLPGRVRYYGCPAEEALGRIPLLKAGRFDDLGAALTWHPADVNTPHRYTTNANVALVIRFAGKASHAAMAPHAGRSALDGAQIMNIGIEFLREHVAPGTLLHYVITEGGMKPNIVPDSAAVSLYVRGPDAATVRSSLKRVIDCARGAAIMTGTRVSWEITHGKCDYIPNDAIQDAMLDAMRDISLPGAEPGDVAFAKALAAGLSRKEREPSLAMIGAPAKLLARPLHREVGDFGRGFRVGGSLDVGDVSYVVPTGQMNAATWPLGVGAHTWRSCAASGTAYAARMARWAAAVLAATGFRLLTEPELLAAAAAEHRAARRGKGPWRSTMDL
jgi:aminobenzoyl-glutamate utilization protein B